MRNPQSSLVHRPSSIVKFAISMALLLIAYLPTIDWMAKRWFETESYYGHGILIPLVSLYLVWQKKDALKKAKLSTDNLGIAFIAVGLVIHILSAALKIYFISGFTLVVVLYGLILYFFGKAVAKSLVFPVFFLLTMIPLPLVLIANITVKMKLFAAQCATVILNHIGFPSIRDGSIIRMPASFISVEAPCSGLRSLISLLTLGLLFAYAIKVSLLKKLILFASSVPIAIISNISRVVAIAVVNDLYGEKTAMGFFHDFTGFMVFAVAFVLLYGVSRLLEKLEDRKWKMENGK